MTFIKTITLTSFIVVFSLLNAEAQLELINDVTSGAPIMADYGGNVTGSPYLYEDFKKGEILFYNQSRVKNMMVRFDGYSGKLQFLKDGNPYEMDPVKVSGFIIYEGETETGGRLFQNGLNFPGFSKNDYFEVLYDQPAGKLYKRHAAIKAPDPNVPYGSAGEIFRSTESFVLIFNGETTTNLKTTNKNQLSKAFKGYENLVKDFINDSSLNLKNDASLVAIMAYVEQKVN